MKKYIFTICSLFVIIIIVLFMNYSEYKKQQIETKKFNNIYEEYNKENLNGLDIITVINKAIDNNEKYEISKDEKGLYIQNDTNSIKIYISLTLNDKIYFMENIHAVGTEAFIQNFGIVEFKCTDIKYHSKTGRVSEMTFEATEY